VHFPVAFGAGPFVIFTNGVCKYHAVLDNDSALSLGGTLVKYAEYHSLACLYKSSAGFRLINISLVPS
jgi:hypothetical protein